MAPIPYFNEKGEVIPFASLMRLEKINEKTFRSTAKAYGPTGGENGAYGGHVYAQSVWAAAQTVGEGFVVHNVTGWFVLGGIPQQHFVYLVENTRDGGNYCTRTVTVTQIAEKGVMFTCTCSFKRAESSSVECQDTLDLRKKYSAVLDGKTHFDHPDAPSQDSTWFRETYLPQHPNHFNPVGGLHLRKVNMAAHNDPLHPLDRRQLIFYSIRGSLPPLLKSPAPHKSKKVPYTREANLHACAHLYASDRNSLFIIPNHLDLGNKFTRMASLSHTVIFHVDVEQLHLPNEPTDKPPNAAPTQMEGNGFAHPDSQSKERKFFMQESWTTRVGGGRGLHTSRLWDPERGLHLATTIQDGLIRFQEDAKVKL